MRKSDKTPPLPNVITFFPSDHLKTMLPPFLNTQRDEPKNSHHKDEADWRAIFAFAREMGLRDIVTFSNLLIEHLD